MPEKNLAFGRRFERRARDKKIISRCGLYGVDWLSIFDVVQRNRSAAARLFRDQSGRIAHGACRRDRMPHHWRYDLEAF